ncbi:hypothetical protein GGR58DRAFT_477302 [Xylaria digitata]|nr:hypothetical protein GGR58DRAFT_477302 [Xylaria digitata]
MGRLRDALETNSEILIWYVIVLLWNLAYVLMIRRSLKTCSYPMPIVGLAINVSWEIVYAIYVAETAFERLGFAVWLLLDLGIVYTTVRFAPYDWAQTSKFVGDNIVGILGLMILIGCWGHIAFVTWFLSEPNRGSGDKTGKWWRGEEGYDTTELAFWSAGVAQLVGSTSSLAMLFVRNHSGGTSYKIWLCRFIGSIFGMGVTNGLLWWYWPEAHSFWTSPLSIFICGLSFICDVIFGLVLFGVRMTETVLPNGELAISSARRQESLRHDLGMRPREPPPLLSSLRSVDIPKFQPCLALSIH